MAAREIESQNVNTTTTVSTTIATGDRHPTLLLRHRLTNFGDEMASALKNKFESSKALFRKKSISELNNTVDSNCSEFKKKFSLKADEVKTEMQSYAPTKPIKENFQSEAEFQKALEQYQQELEAYRTLVALCGYFLEKFGEIFANFLEIFKIKLQDLWSEMRMDRSKINSLQIADVYRDIEKVFLEQINDLFRMMPINKRE